MICLNNYIGLKGCGTSAPPSGLWLNDLPGVSLKQMVSLTNEEEATYIDMWNMIQRRAQLKLSSDVREIFSKQYRLNSLMQSINLGNRIGDAQANPGMAWDYQGFTIEMIESGTDDYVPSPLASIHIQELKFYANQIQSQTVDIKIFDLNTNEELFSYTLTKQLGWNTIPVHTTFHNNYSFNSWSLFIGYAGIGEGSYNPLDMPLHHTTPTCCDVRLRGAYKVGDNYTYGNDSWGLSGIFGVLCSWDAIICQNKEIFKRPYWYALGVELLSEQIYTTKINRYSTVDNAKAERLREEYQTEYNKMLEQLSNGMKLDCDCCIECSGQVQLRETKQFY